MDSETKALLIGIGMFLILIMFGLGLAIYSEIKQAEKIVELVTKGVPALEARAAIRGD